MRRSEAGRPAGRFTEVQVRDSFVGTRVGVGRVAGRVRIQTEGEGRGSGFGYGLGEVWEREALGIPPGLGA